MRRIIVASVLALAALLGGVLTASPAAAHYCDSKCNGVEARDNNQTGIWIYDTWDGNINNVDFYLRDGQFTYRAPWYQPDVDGIYMADTWCADLKQSNDGANWGYYGLVVGWQGGRYFPTTYWAYNRFYNQRRCTSQPHP